MPIAAVQQRAPIKKKKTKKVKRVKAKKNKRATPVVECNMEEESKEQTYSEINQRSDHISSEQMDFRENFQSNVFQVEAEAKADSTFKRPPAKEPTFFCNKPEFKYVGSSVEDRSRKPSFFSEDSRAPLHPNSDIYSPKYAANQESNNLEDLDLLSQYEIKTSVFRHRTDNEMDGWLLTESNERQRPFSQDSLLFPQSENNYLVDATFCSAGISCLLNEEVHSVRSDINSKGNFGIHGQLNNAQLGNIPHQEVIDLDVPCKQESDMDQENQEQWLSKQNGSSLPQPKPMNNKAGESNDQAGRKAPGRKLQDPQMDSGVVQWLIQECLVKGHFPSKTEIKDKARILSTYPGFQASKGWLDKFEKRNQETIQALKRQCGLLSKSGSLTGSTVASIRPKRKCRKNLELRPQFLQIISHGKKLGTTPDSPKSVSFSLKRKYPSCCSPYSLRKKRSVPSK